MTELTALPEELPNDVKTLQSLVLELVSLLQQKEIFIDKLQHQLQLQLKARFGSKTDRIDPNQLVLFARELLAQAEERKEEEEEKIKNVLMEKKKGHGRKPLPAHLPRERVEHDLPAEEKKCPECGGEKIRIGEEISEQLEYIPASFKVLQHVCPTYACPKECEKQVITASKPYQPIEKGLPTARTLAFVVEEKYRFHLPLARIEKRFLRDGIDMSRSTLCGWMKASADLAEPILERMLARVLTSKHVGLDDTHLPILDETKAKTRQGRLWGLRGDEANPYNVYDYTPDRSRDGPLNLLETFKGYVQADALKAHDRLFDDKSRIEVACWAHTRRYFVEAQVASPEKAVTALVLIKKLYFVEQEAKAFLKTLPDTEPEESRREKFEKHRYRLRQEKSAPVLKEIEDWLSKTYPSALPKSPIGKAMAYAVSNWKALNRYLEDGALEIDNNLVEQMFRPVALGRHNYLFAGSDRGGRTAAALYTLISSALRNKIEPFNYLSDLFARLPGHPGSRIDDFLPDRWKKLKENPPGE